jgi:hypothetical protein
MNEFQVKIPNPCPENWNAMTPDKEGRYCHSCNKVVVDFTVMTTDEIKNYFKQVSGTGTCGRFTYEQVQVRRTKKEIFFKSIYDKLQGIKIYPVRYVSVLMLGFVMMMFGCDNERTVGEISLPEDTIFSQSTEHNKSVCQDTSKVEGNIKDTTIIMGDYIELPEEKSR